MDGEEFLTIEELVRLTQREVELPALSKAAGRPVKVRFRRMSMTEYLTLVPLPPPGSETWPAGEAKQRELEWLRTLPEEEQLQRREVLQDVIHRTIARAAVQPRFTVDEARQLAEDAEVYFTAILVESGLLPRIVEDAVAATEG
jgi:hypothetical protein